MADVLITPASGKVEFKDGSNNIDGKIELDGSGNLNITAPGGDLVLGDTTSDIFIGNGVNNIDIVFEQSGEIRPTSGRTLTIGDTVGTLRLESDSEINVNKEFKITAQGGINHVAHGIASGNTVANQLRSSWTAGFDRWYMYPIKDGTSNFGRELTYDFSNEYWIIEGTTRFPNGLVSNDNLTVCSTLLVNNVQVTGTITVDGEETLNASQVALGTVPTSQNSGSVGDATASYIVYDSSNDILHHKDVSNGLTSPIGAASDADMINGQVFKMVGSATHLDGHLTGATTLTLDFTNSDHIDVVASASTTGALNIRADSITADRIKAGSILADKLSVKAVNFVNPISKTESLNGWGGADEETGTGVTLQYLTYDANFKALELANNISGGSRIDDVAARSDTWQLDDNKIYKVTVRVSASSSGAVSGIWYFGLAGFGSATDGTVSTTDSTNGTTTFRAYDANRTSQGTGSTFHFVQGANKTEIDGANSFSALQVYYVIGKNRSIEECPDHYTGGLASGTIRPYIKDENTDTTYAALRLLNYNSGTSLNQSVYFKDITVTELGTGVIVADNIKAGAIETDKLAASAITADKIEANAITATKIAASSITGTEISSATTVTAGTGNNVGVLDGADGTYRIYAGNATPASAPFRVTQSGALTATNATITGNITATSGTFAGTLSASSGTIGGWTIDSSTLFTGTKDVSGYTTNGISINGSGDGSFHSKNFYIDTSGDAFFKGALSGASGTFSGTLTAQSISAGNIQAGSIKTNLLTVGSRDAINPDPTFKDLDEWDGGSLSVSSDYFGEDVIKIEGNNTTFNSQTYLPIEENSSYRVKVLARGDKGVATGGGAYLHVGFYDINKTIINNSSSPTSDATGWLTIGTYHYYGIANGVLSNSTWTIYQAQFGPKEDKTIPSGARYMRIGGLFNRTILPTRPSGDITYLSNYQLIKMSDETIITNSSIATKNIFAGAITTDTLAASAITADKIEANAITATKIAASSITGTEIAAASKITAGTGNNVGVLDGADGTYRIYAGNATPESAPFRVTQSGALIATNAAITGSITATSGTFAGTLSASSGTIGGWTIDSSTLYTGTKDVSGYTTNGISINGSGDGSFHSKNFYIDTSGNAFFKGALSGASGTFSGTLTAQSISAGNIVAGSITGDKLVIGDVTNLVRNARFEDDRNEWTLGDTVSDATWGTALRITANGTVEDSLQVAPYIPVTPGEKYYLSIQVRTDATGISQSSAGNVNVQYGFFEYATNQTTVTNYTNIAKNSNELTSSWFELSGVRTLQTDTYFIRPWVSVREGVDSGNVYWSNFILRKQSGTTLIEDGAITTDKVEVGAITADTIAASAITTNKIEANAITATKIAASTITGTEISSTTSIIAGSGNNIGALDGTGTIRIYAGNATPASAPFRVTQSGALTATNATITGTVTATSGSIGGFTIDSGGIRKGNDTTRISISTAGIHLGANTSGSAPFAVTNAGALTATNATITGAITATSGTFSGSLNSASGTFSGTLTAKSISAGNIIASTITSTELSSEVIRGRELLIGFGGAALNTDPNAADATSWTKFSGNDATFTTVTDGSTGRNVIRSGTPGSNGSWYNNHAGEATKVPVDPTKQYRIQARARRSSDADGKLYVGIAAFDSSGNNIAGDGSQWSYDAASGATASTGWVLYSAVVGPDTANDFPSTARTLAPVLILNYNSTAGYMEAQDIRLEEVNSGTLIRDGAITTDKIFANAITADKIAASTITGTEISSATTVTAGTGNNVGVLDGADGTYRIYAGNATPASAPFRVTQSGALTATNATITGNITATSGSFTGTVTANSGSIGGFTIDSGGIRKGNDTTRISISTAGIHLGANTSGSAPFAVTNAGALTATNATITGAITATSGSFSGSLNSASGTFTGALSAATGTFSGTLTAQSISAGNIQADAITAGKLVVSDFSNIITNPSFSTEGDTGLSGIKEPWIGSVVSISAVNTSASSGAPTKFIGKQTARDVYFDRPIDVKAGEEFTFTLDVNTSQTTHDFNIGFRIFDKDDTNLGWFTSTASNSSTNAGWAEVTINRTMPTNANRAVPFFQINSFDTFGEVFYTNVRLRRRVGSTIIENGAITTDKIQANSINATKIAASSITGTEISSTTTVIAGTGNNVGVLDGADGTYRIYAGNAAPASAPFRVTQSGALTATNATITGNITATSGSFTGTVTANSGSIGGFTIDSGGIRKGNDTTRISISTAGIHLGANTSGSAPFAVTNAGALTATNATITGNITATSGTFAGTLSASSGTIGGWTITSSSIYTGTQNYGGGYSASGITIRDNGVFSSKNFYIGSGGNAFFKGSLEAAGGTFSGTLTAESISAGNIKAGSITASALQVSSNTSASSSMFFDGTNNRIDIKDSNGTLRVRIGKLT